MILDPDNSACKRLISCTHSQQQIVQLLEEIFTSKEELKMIGSLHGDEAQIFIDTLDQVRSVPFISRNDLITVFLFYFLAFKLSPSKYQALDFPNLQQRFQNKCWSVLRKICAHRASLPKSLQIPVCYNRSENPLYRGEFANVWKGEHQGLKVAVKVLEVYSTSDFSKIRNVSLSFFSVKSMH